MFTEFHWTSSNGRVLFLDPTSGWSSQAVTYIPQVRVTGCAPGAETITCSSKFKVYPAQEFNMITETVECALTFHVIDAHLDLLASGVSVGHSWWNLVADDWLKSHLSTLQADRVGLEGFGALDPGSIDLLHPTGTGNWGKGYGSALSTADGQNSFLLTEDQLVSALNFSRDQAQVFNVARTQLYNLYYYNCTHAAVETGEHAGHPTIPWAGFIITPFNFLYYLQTH